MPSSIGIAPGARLRHNNNNDNDNSNNNDDNTTTNNNHNVNITARSNSSNHNTGSNSCQVLVCAVIIGGESVNSRVDDRIREASTKRDTRATSSTTMIR